MTNVKTYWYRQYRIDLHPYAGGFQAFIFPPGGVGTGIEGSPVLVGPDGSETAVRKQILRESRFFVDCDVARRAKGLAA